MQRFLLHLVTPQSGGNTLRTWCDLFWTNDRTHSLWHVAVKTYLWFAGRVASSAAGGQTAESDETGSAGLWAGEPDRTGLSLSCPAQRGVRSHRGGEALSSVGRKLLRGGMDELWPRPPWTGVTVCQDVYTLSKHSDVCVAHWFSFRFDLVFQLLPYIFVYDSLFLHGICSDAAPVYQ